MSSARQPRRESSAHPVANVEPEMLDAESTEYQVVIQTCREDEWIEWAGPILRLPGEEGDCR
jgi:hypothetical protein